MNRHRSIGHWSGGAPRCGGSTGWLSNPRPRHRALGPGEAASGHLVAVGNLAALTKIAQRPAVLLSVALVDEQAELLRRGVAQSVRGPDRAVAQQVAQHRHDM